MYLKIDDLDTEDIKSAESSVESEDYTSESRREDIDRAAMRLYQNLMKKLMR